MPKLTIELEDDTIESDSFVASVIRKDGDLYYAQVVSSVDSLNISDVLVLSISALQAIASLLQTAAGVDLLFNEEQKGGETNGS